LTLSVTSRWLAAVLDTVCDDLSDATNGPVVLVGVEASVLSLGGVAGLPNVSGRKAPRSLPDSPGNSLETG
jgi:hypothetical protein